MHILSVVGARPNFMKIAPLVRALRAHPRVRHTLVHTGQHYDEAMSASFFRTLDIPDPDIHLGIGSGTHAEQVGRTMIAFEKVVREQRPDWVVVVGDVNATCACAITAAKEHVRLAHIEAGLRSFDPRMPEEINRLVTDRLANLLFTTDEIADANLRAEGVPPEKIRRVGNVMIDTLDVLRPQAEDIDVGAIAGVGENANMLKTETLKREQPFQPSSTSPFQPFSLSAFQHLSNDPSYAVMTLHRPSNVDDRAVLTRLVDYVCGELAAQLPVIWSLHPRTEKRLAEFGLRERVDACAGLVLVPPLGYLQMLRLNLGARLMLTDSGGLQEECCVIGTPCLTLRENTERPVTLREHGGVSELVGNDIARIREVLPRMLAETKRPHRPPLWDGHAAERIAQELACGGCPE